ncbi:MAG TPA: GAF domain-containing protein [Candidatus Tumulicola sp.]
MKDSDEKKAQRSRIPGPVRTIWILIGIAGAISHAVGGSANHWPDTDLITMGWLGFAVLGVLLPSIDSIEFPGGGGVKFQEAVAAGEEGIAGLEHALGEATGLIADWLGTVGWLNTYLQRLDVDDDAALRSVFRYCLERMEDAKEWMGDAEEPVRISLWWQDQADGDLFFMFSNDIRDERTKNFRFSPNSGLMGQAFAENRIYNLENALSSSFYVAIREAQVDYHGLLLVPVRVVDQPVGMLSVDRQQKATFGEDAEKVAQGLSELLGYAFSHPRVRTLMRAMPARVDALLLSWRALPTPREPDWTPSRSAEDSERPAE